MTRIVDMDTIQIYRELAILDSACRLRGKQFDSWDDVRKFDREVTLQYLARMWDTEASWEALSQLAKNLSCDVKTNGNDPIIIVQGPLQFGLEKCLLVLRIPKGGWQDVFAHLDEDREKRALGIGLPPGSNEREIHGRVLTQSLCQT